MTATFHAAAPVAVSAILAAANVNGDGAFKPDTGKFVLGSTSAQTLKGGTKSDVIVAETGDTQTRGSIDGGADKVKGDGGANLVTVGYNDKVDTGKGDDRIILGVTRAPTANINCGKGSDRVVVERGHEVKADSVRKRLSSCEDVKFEYGSLKKMGKTGSKMTVRGTLHVLPPAIAVPPAAASAPAPASPPASTSAGGVPVTPPPANPFVPPPPLTVDGATFFTPGVQAGASQRDAYVSYVLRAPIARAELEIGTDPATVEYVVRGYAKGGLRVLLLAGFHGRIPSVAEAQSLKEWARVAGPGAPLWKEIGRPDLAVTQIEFGNETSFAYQGTQKRGGEYAQRVRDAANAIRSVDPGVGLLVQADNANQSDNWIGQMFAAVPELANYSAGWTVHPYGPQSKWQGRIDEVIDRTGSQPGGASIPIMITEYGIATDDGNCLSDNYGWPLCLTYAQAAANLRSTALAMKERYGKGRIGMMLYYNDIDLRAHNETGEREHYFGARQVDGARKGDYTTAVEELMAAGT